MPSIGSCPKSQIRLRQTPNEILNQVRFLDLCDELDLQLDDPQEIKKIQTEDDWKKYIEETYFH